MTKGLQSPSPHYSIHRCWFLVSAFISLSACKDSKVKLEPIELFQPPMLEYWRRIESIPNTGQVIAERGSLILTSGSPMTAAVFDAWKQQKLPVTNYEITFEAQRVKGHDFFAALTCPIHHIDTNATLVLGGWGGSLVGISSIDGQDASENTTRSEQQFINGQWYRLRMRVTDDDLMVWLDDRIIINTNLKGRKISLRMGEIESCAPFGLATFGTTGRVRNLAVKAL